jgi:putative CocE/NonD family hydrolase
MIRTSVRAPWSVPLAVALVACSGGGSAPPPAEEPDPPVDLAALAQSPAVVAANTPFAEVPAFDESRYVAMSDGVRLAVSFLFPPGLAGQAPAVFIDSWYGRPIEATMEALSLYRAAGFVVALADSRGFGASFGAQEGLMTERARQDQGEVIAWLAAQPWSNGKVAVVGLSLSGTLADVAISGGAPALGAAIIRASDFDEYAQNMLPGGVPNLNMMEGIAGFVRQSRFEACAQDRAACAELAPLAVDGDTDLQLLQQAARDHQASVDGAELVRAVYRDDRSGTRSFDDMSPMGHLVAIDAARVPARVSASWTDGATADGALARFVGAPGSPMEVSIGATTHSGGLDSDPFARQPFEPARPGPGEQFAADVDFVRRALAGAPIGRQVRYRVLGADSWKVTERWPPPGVDRVTLHLGPGALTPAAGEAGTASYTVDPTTSSGQFNRWASQRNAPVHYGDQGRAPGRRMAFDAAPVERDTEVVGAAEVCLAMRIDQTDGVVIAYLEDVGPDGRVTHLTEGELRLLHRKTGGGAGACDPGPGARRSFRRADGAAVVPGERMKVELPLLATAALVRRGHHLRLSLAGADAGTFAPPAGPPATWVVDHGGADGSTVTVPLRAWAP